MVPDRVLVGATIQEVVPSGAPTPGLPPSAPDVVPEPKSDELSASDESGVEDHSVSGFGS